MAEAEAEAMQEGAQGEPAEAGVSREQSCVRDTEVEDPGAAMGKLHQEPVPVEALEETDPGRNARGGEGLQEEEEVARSWEERGKMKEEEAQEKLAEGAEDDNVIIAEPPDTGLEEFVHGRHKRSDSLAAKRLDFEAIDFDQFGDQPPDLPPSDGLHGDEAEAEVGRHGGRGEELNPEPGEAEGTEAEEQRNGLEAEPADTTPTLLEARGEPGKGIVEAKDDTPEAARDGEPKDEPLWGAWGSQEERQLAELLATSDPALQTPPPVPGDGSPDPEISTVPGSQELITQDGSPADPDPNPSDKVNPTQERNLLEEDDAVPLSSGEGEGAALQAPKLAGSQDPEEGIALPDFDGPLAAEGSGNLGEVVTGEGGESSPELSSGDAGGDNTHEADGKNEGVTRPEPGGSEKGSPSEEGVNFYRLAPNGPEELGADGELPSPLPAVGDETGSPEGSEPQGPGGGTEALEDTGQNIATPEPDSQPPPEAGDKLEDGASKQPQGSSPLGKEPTKTGEASSGGPPRRLKRKIEGKSPPAAEETPKRSKEPDRLPTTPASKQAKKTKELGLQVDALTAQLNAQARTRDDLERKLELERAARLESEAKLAALSEQAPAQERRLAELAGQVAALAAQLEQESQLREALERKLDEQREALPVSRMPSWSEEADAFARLLEEQRELLASQVRETERLRSAAEQKVGLLNHQVQDLEVLTDIAESMEDMFSSKDRVLRQALWTAFQALFLCLGLLIFLYSFRDPMRNSLRPT